MAESSNSLIAPPARRFILLSQRPNGLSTSNTPTSPVEQRTSTAAVEEQGRERLKRHREEVAGRVAIPENWGQENLLSDWVDCTPFDTLLAPAGLSSARAALAAEGRRRGGGGGGQRLRIQSRCC
ncbi:Protein BIC1 [Linum grandiflorum]